MFLFLFLFASGQHDDGGKIEIERGLKQARIRVLATVPLTRDPSAHSSTSHFLI